ncbi:MAG: C2 family cysteine protease, partial [Gemmataceae bacterium]
MTQVSPANRFQPTLEALEDRFLPAVTSVIQGGVLRVTGDQQANTVFMMLAGRTLTVMTESGTRTFNIGAFGRIFIDVKGGDDTVNLNSRGAEGLPLMKPAEIHGGPGNDMLVGTEANDSLFGEANDDRLFGGPGQDFLSGGDGADLMDGGENFDGYQDVFNPNVWAVNQRPGEQPHAVDPTDVTQGYEGNCQLLASLVTIARTQPAFLNNSITHGVGSNYSLRMWNATRFTWVTVRLTFNGKWDDHDPRPATPQPGQDREYWTILYWQAYRRLMATQPRLLWANSANALTAVSGFTTWSTWNTLENG